MTCKEFADFILDYTARDLPSGVAASFERHLSRCPDCRAYLAQYQATVQAGREAFSDEEAAIPDDVPEELIRAILDSRRS